MAFFQSLASRQFARHGQQYGIQQLFSGYSTSLARGGAPLRLQSTLSSKLHGASNTRALPWLMKGAAVAGVGLGLASLTRSPIYCDGTDSPTKPTSPKPLPVSSPPGDGLPPPPVSSVSLYELSFGTVAGICAGVFVKKGAKMTAWFLGGIFVLLQYLNSASVVRVDWKRIANKFENLFYTTDATGARKPPNVGSLWNWLVNFLTADFQPRASFLAGFALGLRVG